MSGVARCPRLDRRAGLNGVSLVELLVSMLIVTIVASAALVVFRTTAEHEGRQQENIDQIENLRAAFFTVGRDIRMAGNGLGLLGVTEMFVFVPEDLFNEDAQDQVGSQKSNWFKPKGGTQFGAVALSGTDSGTADPNKADTLTIFRADAEAINNFAALGEAYNPGSSAGTLTLNKTVTEGIELADGDIIALSNGTVAMILQARINAGVNTSTLTIGHRFMPEAALPGGGDFPVGTPVYNLKNVSFVTYYLDTATRRLMANYHDKTPDPDDPTNLIPNIAVVANNIEDFQVQCSPWPSLSVSPTFGPCTATNPAASVNAVRLGMISRAENRFANIDDDEIGAPIELMGHTASTESGFARRILVEVIQLRNYGPL